MSFGYPGNWRGLSLIEDYEDDQIVIWYVWQWSAFSIQLKPWDNNLWGIMYSKWPKYSIDYIQNQSNAIQTYPFCCMCFKILEYVLLFKYQVYLSTSNLQFAFKENSSTIQCRWHLELYVVRVIEDAPITLTMCVDYFMWNISLNEDSLNYSEHDAMK